MYRINLFLRSGNRLHYHTDNLAGNEWVFDKGKVVRVTWSSIDVSKTPMIGSYEETSSLMYVDPDQVEAVTIERVEGTTIEGIKGEEGGDA